MLVKTKIRKCNCDVYIDIYQDKMYLENSKFGFKYTKNNHDNYDFLLGTKTGKRPLYLNIIDYVLNSNMHRFTKKELVEKSGYNANCSELFSSLNRNEILIFNYGYPYMGYWTKGKEFDNWRKEFYPESLTKFPVSEPKFSPIDIEGKYWKLFTK